VLPAILATILSLITGREDWIVLIGVYLLVGIALDTGVYSWVVKYQPPWMTFVLTLFEFAIIYVLAHVLKLNLTNWEAVALFWASWLLAVFTKIVILPLASLTYLESAGEFRRIDWSIPESQVPLSVIASEEEAKAGPGPIVREASGVHAALPKKLPSPSAIHEVPVTMQGGGGS
jgi:hypothetical protein